MSRQLDLFGGGPSRRKGREVGPAEALSEHEALARAIPADCRFGTSSWSFPGWNGVVYDREATASHLAKRGLAAYARHPLLRAVGIDRTFYSPISSEAFAAYADAVPDDFRFLVKAAGLCTTPRERDSRAENPLFLDAGFATAEVVGPYLEGLGEKGGALVFQFPPIGAELRSEPKQFAERLGGFLAALPAEATYAVELRDRTLLSGEYFDVLRSAGAVHCFGIHPRMPSLGEQRRLAGTGHGGPLIARWMLHSGLRYDEAVERYQPFSRIVDEDSGSRESLAELCVEALALGQPALITANNKAEGSAPHSVFRLADAVAHKL